MNGTSLRHPTGQISAPTSETRCEATPVIRFVDLCAGIGGFHVGLELAQRVLRRDAEGLRFECVLAADIDTELRELYVRNFPSIRTTYAQYFPAERISSVQGMSDLYDESGELLRTHGDLAGLLDADGRSLRPWPDAKHDSDTIVPDHDLLCAGFPCQPFSKSGAQKGFDDLNGTVFRMIAVILAAKRPQYLFLENVGNFERHDSGNTWRRVREVLEEDLGYHIRFTSHVGSGSSGSGLLSPHHLGLPHHRERFFIVGQRHPFSTDVGPIPHTYRKSTDPVRARSTLESQARRRLQEIVVRGSARVTAAELETAELSRDRYACVNHWSLLVDKLQEPSTRSLHIPSAFPVWGFELDPWQHYPSHENPAEWRHDLMALSAWRAGYLRTLQAEPWFSERNAPTTLKRAHLRKRRLNLTESGRWVDSWPAYASSRKEWPRWKRRFIEQNRDWALQLWRQLDPAWLRWWLDTLATMRPSHQKLEWNCKGSTSALSEHVLQFRPSGLRVKCFAHVPALVAMTATQVPVVRHLSARDTRAQPLRHLLTHEALELQGFPTHWLLPRSRDLAFRALGNAVHTEIVATITRSWLRSGDLRSSPRLAPDVALVEG
jgi:DNA (cytosine-5)-methyltransferase 1